jgi:hypothetical protein
MLKAIPRDYFDPSKGTLKLLWEEEWRNLGITQSLGWEHYEVHEPEPHILLFKYAIHTLADALANEFPGDLSTTNHLSSKQILHHKLFIPSTALPGVSVD